MFYCCTFCSRPDRKKFIYHTGSCSKSRGYIFLPPLPLSIETPRITIEDLMSKQFDILKIKEDDATWSFVKEK